MNYQKLSIAEKFGQMLLIGLDVYEIDDEIIKLIKDYKIGGVVLYKKNYTSINKMVAVINKLKRANQDNKIPLFIAIDQENGWVNRLPKDIEPILGAFEQAKTKNLKVINIVNELTCLILKNVGINMNLAPDLDILRSNKNKVIGKRSYGKTKEDVITYGIPFMKSLQKNKIVSVIKHFPGHGLTIKDSHVRLPKIKDITTLNNVDLKVFREAFQNGNDALMVGHLRVSGYGLKPASINAKFLQDYLFTPYHYDGLIMTDDLRMRGLRYRYGLKKSISLCINAGVNMLMVKYQKCDIKKVYSKILEQVENYELDIDKIDKSCEKIVKLKEKYQINNDFVNFSLKIDKINAKIKEVNKLIAGGYYED